MAPRETGPSCTLMFGLLSPRSKDKGPSLPTARISKEGQAVACPALLQLPLCSNKKVAKLGGSAGWNQWTWI